MKIKLLKSTFYFNDPVNLTPHVKETVVDLQVLSDDVIRKLNLGLTTGVIDIVEGKEGFVERATALSKKKTQTVTEQPVVVTPEIVEAVVEPTLEVVENTEEVATEEVVEKVTPAKKPTAKTTKTPTKKA